MPDFSNLRRTKPSAKPVDPEEIFRRLRKPPGIGDLYQSQGEILRGWHLRRTSRDVVLKLHTGGGKTLVGLLIGQSMINEDSKPVLYLVPNVQLVEQTLRKAQEYGIAAVKYQKGAPLPEAFANGRAILVATYNALFNGRSKFGIRDSGRSVALGGLIVDDAHTAFDVVRDAFTLRVERTSALYKSLCGLFRGAFIEIDRVGTFDDLLDGSDTTVLEVPYWAWNEKREVVRESLRPHTEDFTFEWPLVRDRLRLCHALISRAAFTITPMLPFMDLFPSFSECPRRVYMSATIADDSSIVRTFGADPQQVSTALVSRSLAGISERMILVPELMPFKIDLAATTKAMCKHVSSRIPSGGGVVVLVPSNAAAKSWTGVAPLAEGAQDVAKVIDDMQHGRTRGPVTLANRYDGIDLPGDACRLLIMSGLPVGTSDYELWRSTALGGGGDVNGGLAQRIEQGIGRGARGSGDYCVVLLVGPSLVSWISKDANARLLTSATRAQVEMGDEVSRSVADEADYLATIDKCLDREEGWTGYHAERLADLVDAGLSPEVSLAEAAVERRAFGLMVDGYYEQAIAKVVKFLDAHDDVHAAARGWLQQLAARAAFEWSNKDLAEELQRSAFALSLIHI